MFAATLRSDCSGTPLWTFRLFCLAAASFIVWGSEEISALVGFLRYPARILSAGGVGYFWLFAMAVFSSRPLRTMHAVPIVAHDGARCSRAVAFIRSPDRLKNYIQHD